MTAAAKVGDILAGKYRVDRILGEGGMGVVVAATHLTLEEKVALKFMLPSATADENMVRRFVREARAAVKLKSEHVARVLDVGTLESNAPYIVMQYLEGEDLAWILDAKGPLPLDEIADYVIQACDAIAEAHALGIVHRDLKPANLFVTKRAGGSALVKVLDFGVSKATALGDSDVTMTKSGAMLGSPLYMSPEQMKCSRDVDARADVWSLGVIMFELATDRVPFEADTVGALMAKVLVERPQSLKALRPELPDAFVDLVMSCLESHLPDRCPDVAEIATTLAQWAPKSGRILAERISTIVHGSEKLRIAVNASSPPQALDVTVRKESKAPAKEVAEELPVPTTTGASDPPLEPEVAKGKELLESGADAVAPVATSAKTAPDPPAARRSPLVYALPIVALAGVVTIVVAMSRAGIKPAEATVSSSASAPVSVPAPVPVPAPASASAFASASASASASAFASASAPAATAAVAPKKTPSKPAASPAGSSKKKGVLDSWD